MFPLYRGKTHFYALVASNQTTNSQVQLLEQMAKPSNITLYI